MKESTMPLDEQGTYRHNDQSARLHSAKPEKPLAPKGTPEEKTEEESPIKEHLKAMHSATGNAHTHVEHHGDGTHTSHHVDESGDVSGPDEHESIEALKEHLAQLEGEESDEGETSEEPEHAHVSALGM